MLSRAVVGLIALTVGLVAGTPRGEAGSRAASVPRKDFEIFSVRLDGNARRNLSRSPLEDQDPAPSPNGRRILFSRGSRSSLDDPRNGLWLMNADGSGQRKVPGTERLGAQVWSPDGARVALTMSSWTPPYGYKVVVLRLADGQMTTIEDASNPTCAPDGKRLVFLSDPITSFRAGFRNLSVADSDGANRRVVFTKEEGINSQPVWSTHGSLVAETFHDDSLHVIDMETGQERLVARRGWNPAWSPDGLRLAFARYTGICLTRVGQSGTRLLVSSRNGSITPRRPIWSPDGRSIAFITKHQLRVVDVASRRFRVVTQSRTGFSAPVWSPNGRRLYFAARLPA